MRKTFLVSIWLIGAVIIAPAQTKSIDAIQSQIKSLKAEKSISLEYDKSSNYSKLMMLSDGFGKDQNQKNGLSSFTFGMMHGFTGRELTNPPDVFILTFWAKGKNSRFAEFNVWIATIDGEALEIGEARYAKKKGDDREFLNFVVSRANLQRIADGKIVSFKIGNAEFMVSAEMLQNFRKFLVISNPNQNK